ncbi:hypothetical protein ACTFIT_006087 [Dictyostelium discoideum]
MTEKSTSNSNTPVVVHSNNGTPQPMIGLNRKLSNKSKTSTPNNNSNNNNNNNNINNNNKNIHSPSRLLDTINKLQLDALEYVDLPIPTNIYGLSSIPLLLTDITDTSNNNNNEKTNNKNNNTIVETTLAQSIGQISMNNSTIIPNNSNNNNSSKNIFISKQNKLYISSRTSLISVESEEDLETGSLSWLTNEIISNSDINPPPPPPPPPQTTSTTSTTTATTSTQTTTQATTTATSRNPSSPSKITTNSTTSTQPNQFVENQIVSVDSFLDEGQPVIAFTQVTPFQLNQPNNSKGKILFNISDYESSINDSSGGSGDTTPTIPSTTSTSTQQTNSQQNFNNNNNNTTTAAPPPQQPPPKKRLDILNFSFQIFDIDFIPFHLTHSRIEQFEDGNSKNVFLLSGSDEKIHMYYYNGNEFVEGDISRYFPEMCNLGSNALKIEIKYYQNFRLVAIGCQNGLLKLSIINEITKEIKSESFFLDGPVQTLCIYNENIDLNNSNNNHMYNCYNYNNNNNNNNDIDSFGNFDINQDDSIFSIINEIKSNTDQIINNSEQQMKKMHLLVGSIIGYSVVYRNIFNQLLQDSHLLEYSDSFDSVTSVHVFDIDADGQNELLIGTYGMELLVYKKQQQPIDNDSNGFIYKLNSHRHFSHPILGIQTIELMNDGIKQLIIMTMFGVYIMRVPILKYQEELSTRIELIKEILKLKQQQQQQQQQQT